MYYPSETQVTPLTLVRRERVLPTPGEILVKTGERVDSQQVVARAVIAGKFHIIPAARRLGVSAAQLEKCLRVQPGDTVKRGQVVAKRGLRAVSSPVDGVVRATGGGRVLIETERTPFELFAHIPGVVTSVVEPHGLVIETPGAVVQGVWGAGGAPTYEETGVIKCLIDRHDQPLRPQSIDLSCHGTIVVGGAGLSEAALEQAQESNVRGIVIGSVAANLIPRLEKQPFPIVVTEGIGAAPMSEPIFRLLSANEGREAAISSRVQPRWPAIRPEVIIPMPGGTQVPQTQHGAPLSVGTTVRVIRAPYSGVVGTVVSVPSQGRYTPAGARIHGVEVNVGAGRPVFIPLVNLEVLR